jgi:hypothetical protein
MAGFTLELEDASGNVLAKTRTDSQGRYTFNQLSGPAASPDNASGVSAVGTYKVVLVAREAVKPSSATSNPIVIGSGDTNIQGIDFTVSLLRGTM